jgi:L-aminoadipate-semialdehyde dehydrogenase
VKPSGQEDEGYVDTLSASSDPAKHYWRGIRDRMYRSGDLGRYDTEGGVECIGEAQVAVLSPVSD